MCITTKVQKQISFHKEKCQERYYKVTTLKLRTVLEPINQLPLKACDQNFGI